MAGGERRLANWDFNQYRGLGAIVFFNGRFPSRRVLDTQQTRYIDPVLGQCWATVCDGGPTLTQHWVDVSCLLWTRDPCRDDAPKLTGSRCQFLPPPNVAATLVKWGECETRIGPTMAGHLVLAAILVWSYLLQPQSTKQKTFFELLYSVGPTSKTLGRRCTNVIQMFCVCWACPLIRLSSRSWLWESTHNTPAWPSPMSCQAGLPGKKKLFYSRVAGFGGKTLFVIGEPYYFSHNNQGFPLIIKVSESCICVAISIDLIRVKL